MMIVWIRNPYRCAGSHQLHGAGSYRALISPSGRYVFSRARQISLVLLLIVCAGSTTAWATNALSGHPSPYLAMHGQDPVDWRTWQAQPVARARRENKLLYLSVGYFSCHWCHVMHRESYLDPGIAAVLNKRYVPIKIDRELQPALDHHLMEFMQATRGHAGWPLNVFLTPEGYPLYATTYLPADRFRALLERLDTRWREDREELARFAMQAAAAIQSRRSGVDAKPLDASTAREYELAFVRGAAEFADLDNGGFGARSKFPTTPQVQQLLRIASDRPDPILDDFLRLTLERMAGRGMRDHLGGGFFRYSTDPEWRVPHFEKMLYDNALLAELYLDAAERLHEPGYRAVATETLDFMLRELWQDGALIASLSSVDNHNVEGGYYLWQDTNVERLLTAEQLAVASLVWELRGTPTLEHGRLPNMAADDGDVARQLDMSAEQVAEIRQAAHTRLMAERAARGLPRDVKRLAGWNGLALAVFSRAAALDDGAAYGHVSHRLRAYLADTLWDGEQLLRAVGPEGAVGTASLQDYAFVARGLLAYAGLSGAPADLALARAIIDAAWARFRTEHGWRQSEDNLIPYGSAEAVIADGSLPSSSAVLLGATLELAKRTHDSELHARAAAVLWTASTGLGASPFSYAPHIGLLRKYPPPAN